MENDFWLNLASKDLAKAKTFYTKIGFKLNDRHQAPHMVSLFVGRAGVILNLFPEAMHREFSQSPVTDTKQSTEVLFSLGAESRAAVDDMAKRVTAAGGTVFAGPGEKDGWMYGCGFADPDGHRWSVLFMDMSKLPKS